MTTPGKPGIPPKWTSSGKIGVGTAIGKASDIWFTISHGIINEVYYPRIDTACIRDIGFIVTDGKKFFSEEKRHTRHNYKHLGDGVLAYHLTNTCEKGNYRIEKIVITDPYRNVLLQEIQFIPLKGALKDYHLYALVSPHIANAGFGNSGWIGDYKGVPMMFAERKGISLACSASAPFIGMNCGYVGTSDSWQDLSKNKQMTTFYESADDGNIALGAEIDIMACEGKFVFAVGFGGDFEEAALQARASLSFHFKSLCKDYISSWKDVQKNCTELGDVDDEGGSLFRTSISILKCHKEKKIAGANIASLSIPWGFAKGDDNLGGYHLIWPRDQVETAFAFLAAKDFESARHTLRFLLCTQEADGHWEQCFWVDGKPYWEGIQLDETAFPLLLADALKKENHLENIDPFPMVAKAVSFLLQNGPSSKQDRWEEEEGYNPFSISLQIAALLIGADFFEEKGISIAADYLRKTADFWNESIEKWLYVQGTDLAKNIKIDGYYVRVAPPEICENVLAHTNEIIIKNRPESESKYPFSSIISIDALALVRFGLRSANDPRILNTVKAIDALLKTDTKKGPVWHRYNEDGYGEHVDGSPYDGTGIGRGWPLLVGERAHYELALGNKTGALNLLRTFAKMAGVGGLFPEQIWDTDDIPNKRLYNGHSTGAAKPLVWAHAEYITLLRSLKDEKVFGMPTQTKERYIVNKIAATHAFWRENYQTPSIQPRKTLRLQFDQREKVTYSLDGGKTSNETKAQALTELGLFFLDLPTESLLNGSQIQFSIKGKSFQVIIDNGGL